MRFVRENHQMTNKICISCNNMCCKCYWPILTPKGNICGLEMMIGHLLIALLPVHLYCAMVPPGMARVFKNKAQTSDHFGPLHNGDGGGRGGRGLSVHRRGSALLMIAPDCTFLSDRARSKCHRQTVEVQSVLGNVRSVRRCAMQ